MVATNWITKFYDPSQAPEPRPQLPQGTAISADAEMVLYAAKKGYATTRKAYEYLGMTRAKVIAGHRELVSKGLLVGIGQGGARRYLVNVTIGDRA